uniref:Annexin A4 n=1 Tax=Magallana gigas TaxID=29159 RepID=K1QM99_MAGGI
MGSAPPPQTGGYGGGQCPYRYKTTYRGYGANPYQAIQGCYQQYQNNPQYQQQVYGWGGCHIGSYVAAASPSSCSPGDGGPVQPADVPEPMVCPATDERERRKGVVYIPPLAHMSIHTLERMIGGPIALAQVQSSNYLKQRKVEEDDTEEEEEEDNEEETDPKVEAMLKEKLRSVYIDELMRRLKVSGTLDITEGTIGFYHTYGPTDPVVEFMATKDEDLTKKKWNAEYDVQYLRSAMRGLGTNEDAITHVITTRNNAQRQDLKKKYKTSYGREVM